MIKLQKRLVPAAVAEAIAERAARYAGFRQAGAEIPEGLAGAYKAPEVKALLREETFEKCAYCESKVLHIDFGDVEHIKPKDTFHELRYSYENLTLACGVCNNKKRNFYSEETPLLNPYIDDPKDHLMAIGPMVLRTPGSDRGLVTQKILDLNRPSLVERRTERLEAIASMADQLAKTKSAAVREVLLGAMSDECSAKNEFSFVVSEYANRVVAQLSA